MAKEGQETERRERWRQAALERDAEEERLKAQDAAKAREKGEAAKGEAVNSADAAVGGTEVSGDPLSSFFSEIKCDKDNTHPPKVERLLNEKYSDQELGTPQEQMDRLLQHNFKWKNLNAFETLQLGADATVEDIKQR